MLDDSIRPLLDESHQYNLQAAGPPHYQEISRGIQEPAYKRVSQAALRDIN